MVALRWNESSVNLAPTDLSMSLSEDRKGSLEPPQEDINVDQAIEDLNRGLALSPIDPRRSVWGAVLAMDLVPDEFSLGVHHADPEHILQAQDGFTEAVAEQAEAAGARVIKGFGAQLLLVITAAPESAAAARAVTLAKEICGLRFSASATVAWPSRVSISSSCLAIRAASDRP